VDDAGAGYASLRHVVDLHPHFLKLDRSWITGIHRDPAGQAVVSGLLGFANSTGAALIAEGIESPEDLQTLRDLGVGYGQGFLFGIPLPASETTAATRPDGPDASRRIVWPRLGVERQWR
jgi:EAL domain-containing protein (putative c-di-GMP-specific phosphodiesterase class I)